VVKVQRAGDLVADALLRFLSLLSYAHVRDEQGRPCPLLHVEVQSWMRKLHRTVRGVDIRPGSGRSGAQRCPSCRAPTRSGFSAARRLACSP
jgi:hypothetical protein